jgi:hypothetical protein
MTEDPRKLITEQTNTIGLIKRIIINYKKLPKATLPRTRARLSDLKTLWKKAQHNGIHNGIMGSLLRQRLRTGRSYVTSNKTTSSLPRMPTTTLRINFMMR